MSKSISREQGDNNLTEKRKDYSFCLDEETQRWIERDGDCFLHQALSTLVMNMLSKTEGAYITDLQGKRYLDLHGNGVHNAGFSNPRVIDAVIRQLQEGLAFTPRRYSNIPAIKLAEKLIDISPEGLNRVLFCPGGSEAIEMAIMLAKQVTGKWKTISYWDSYHGNGFQASSICGEEHFLIGNGPMVPGALHIEFPNYYRNPWGFTNQQQINDAYLRQVKVLLKRNPDVAALIAEPISATPVVPSESYWQEIRNICDEYGIFLIFDEIIEGFGRTGKMFASEHFVVPDVLVLGKSLGGGVVPFAGIVTKDEYNVLQHRSIGHFTHEKNPLCAAAGLAEIEYIEECRLVENSEVLGAYILQKLGELKDEFKLIGNVAGKGLHIGIDLVKDRKTKDRAVEEAEQIMYFCMNKGVAFKIIEGNIITMRPSLIINKDNCDFILETLKSAFKQINN